MGIMVSEVYEALVEAGASKERAKAAAESIPVAEQLATKQDLAELRAATKQDLAELSAATKQDLARLDAKIGTLEGKIGDLDAKIGGLDVRTGGLEGKIGGLEAKMWKAGIAIAGFAVLLNQFLQWAAR